MFTCGLLRSNFALAMILSFFLIYPSMSYLSWCAFFAGRLGDDLFSDRLRSLLVVSELHRVRRATLRCGTHVGGVPEHFRERDVRRDDLRTARSLFRRLDHAATPIEIAGDCAHVIFGRSHFDFHDRFEQYRARRTIG